MSAFRAFRSTRAFSTPQCGLKVPVPDKTVTEAIEAARASEIVEVLPNREKEGDDFFLVLPEAAGYPESRVKLPKQAPRQ